MLAGVSRWLAKNGGPVSVLSRGADAFCAGHAPLHALGCDYREPVARWQQLERARQRHGPFDLVVAWIHMSTPDFLFELARTLADQGNQPRLFHLVGSGFSHPDRRRPSRYDRLIDSPHIRYRRIRLGFVPHPSGVQGESRWLSHAEICAGVECAIVTDAADHTIGILRPWNLRPASD
jgi:hypothetical protein